MSDPLPLCPECGRPLAPDAPHPVCPGCLLAGALVPLPADPGGPDQPAAVLRLGGYELLELLGRGGMGQVWRARQLGASREVALKVIASGLLASDAERRRFQAEVEAAAGLDHPNIVPVYEVGEAEGRPYFTMKLLPGGTLADRLRASSPSSPSRPIPSPGTDLPSAIPLLAAVARAVHHAHERGVLHRDLKPANILLDAEGRPLVTDFGLARRLGGGATLTLSGDVLGTPGYLAPEIAAGGSHRATVASDLHGLGAILYELLTGRPPFAADTPLATLRQVVEEPPRRPSGLNPRVDRDLETVCLKCLEKDPARRYPSALALAEELERWTRGEPIRARPVTAAVRALRWAKRRPALAALGVLLAAAPAVIISVLLDRNAAVRAQAGETRRQLYAADLYMAQHALEEGNVALARAALAAHLPRSGEPDLRGFEWRHLWDKSRSEAVAVLAGHAFRVTGLAFSPDGRTLATGGHDQTVRLWDVASWESRNVIEPGFGRIDRLAWCPEAPLLALANDEGRVGLWDLERKRLHWEFACPRQARIFFLPGQHQVAVHAWGDKSPAARTIDGHHHFVRTYDWQAGRWAGEWEMSGDLEAVSFDGRVVATSANDPWMSLGLQDWIELRDATSGTLRRIVPMAAYFAVLSPDGERVAAAAFGSRVIQLAGPGDAPQVTLLGGHGDRINALAFSPAGLRLASASADHSVRLWDAAAEQEARRFLGHEGEVWAVAFSPDGRLLASGAEDGRVHVWPVEADSRAAQASRLYPPFVLAPDGHRLAALRGKDGGDPLKQTVVRDLRTGHETEVGAPGGGGAVCFVGDGLYLLQAGPDGLRRLQAWSLVTGNSGRVVELPESASGFHHQSASPDAMLLAAACADGKVRVWEIATGRLVKTSADFGLTPILVEFSRDGRLLVASLSRGDGRAGLHLWELPLGRLRHAAEWTGARAGSIGFSPDSRMVAVGLGDGVVELRDVRDGRLLGRLADRLGAIGALDFSADGRTLATSYTGSGGALKLWHLATWREAAVLHRGSTCPRWLRFSADGERLVGVDWHGSQHIFLAPPLAELDAEAAVARAAGSPPTR